MTVKSAAGLAFATACLMSFAAIPVAKAQTYYDSRGNPSPSAATGSYGSTTENYAPQTQGSASSNMGTYGSATGNYAPPPSAGAGTEVVTNGPQGSAPPNWSPRQNVIESERYDRLLESNRGFREARIRKECGPITDPQLHQQCMESFAQYEPSGASTTGYGSSTPARRHRSSYGR